MWNLDGPDLPESAFSTDTFPYSKFSFFNSTYFIFFHQRFNLDNFIPEANGSFLSISKYGLYIRIGILIGHKWQKWFQFRLISKFQHRPSRKLQLWILVPGSELTLSYYCKTVLLKNLWLCSLHWLEFFHQDLHRQVFSLKNVFSLNQMLHVQSIIAVPLWRSRSQCDCASCWSVLW